MAGFELLGLLEEAEKESQLGFHPNSFLRTVLLLNKTS